MLPRTFIPLLVLLASVATAAEPQHGEFPSEKLKVGDVTREYRLIVPESVDLTKPAPLVFAFHGFLIDSKDLMPKYTHLGDTARKHGFILVFPNAVDANWGLSPDKARKDIAYFDALLKQLSSDYRIDRNQVYAVGMSNGGFFAHLLGQFRSDKVAAVASHSGLLGVHTVLGINAPRKFPVLIVHGDKDRLLSVDFARENRDKYRREGHEVKYVEVKGLGHTWATKSHVNETIWSFFAEHPLAKKKQEPAE